MKLSFFWWNTSLSPAGRERATPDQRHYAHGLINFLITDLGADFIALGEVKEDDVNSIKESCSLEGYAVHNGTTLAGKSKFDTCAIYNKSTLTLENTIDISARKNERTYKIAQRLDFSLLDYEFPFHVLVSHWPSRLFIGSEAPERAYFGMKLRAAVDEIIGTYKDDATFLLLGDYNDEPFSLSLSEYLMATRDRCLVKKRKDLLYNPFWRTLGPSSVYSRQEGETTRGVGTYYHKSGNLTRWRTFDQIIFPPAFLGKTVWHLNEEYTQVIEIPGYTDLIIDNKQIFDHLPVVGVIEKVA